MLRIFELTKGTGVSWILFFFLIEEEHLSHRAVRSSLFLVVFLKRSLSGVLGASFFVLKSLIKAVVHL